MTDYTDFLRQKIKMANFQGFNVEPGNVHPVLYPHQKDIVRWAVLGGNRAIFAKFGLGKSIMQIEWMRQIIGAAGGLGLIVCPLGVRQELVRGAVIAGLQAIDRLMPKLHTFSLAAGSMELDNLLHTANGMGTADVRKALGMRA